MSTEEALDRIERITEKTQPLRVRTEGLTFVIWGICVAASYLTTGASLALGARRDVSPLGFFVGDLFPLFWFVVALLTTIGLWRSAALGFQPGLPTPRIVLFFAGWLVLVFATIVVLTYLEANHPQPWHIVGWAVLMALFAVFDPLRFTAKGRWAAAFVAVVALAAAAYGFASPLHRAETSLLTGLGLGIPMLAAGLVLLYRG
jgi:hypothetical protein